MKEALYGKTLDELQALVATLSMPRFTAGQLAKWLYKSRVDDIAAMTDISLANRVRLSEAFMIGAQPPVSVVESRDGTRKYLFGVGDNRYVESAYIPEADRATLCVSSQVGCRMGCAFCATGRQGFAANLSTNEILNQIASLPERDKLTNVVFMGMGEPMDNCDNVMRAMQVLTAPWGYAWSPTRITLSSVGVLPTLEKFLNDSDVNLAISLHNPFHDERAAIMPVERAYPIAEVVELIRRFDFSHQRRVSFEYIVFKDTNHSRRYVDALARLLNGLRCRINLIRFHAIPDSPFVSPDDAAMVRFRDELTRKGIITTIRASRGEDIQAACGLLSTRRMMNEN